MIDWHCHILPGIDDGPPDVEQSMEMAALLASAGYSTVYCTPHLMRGCYDASNDRVREGVAELQAKVTSSGIPLTLKAGREYWLDEFLPALLDDPLTLGESREVLVEIPSNMSGDFARELLYQVVRKGYIPVIAHPERCGLMEPPLRSTGFRGLLGSVRGLLGNGRPDRSRAGEGTGNPLVDYLRDLGCSFQGNIGSFTGFYGSRVKVVAEELRRRGLYDRYGSDLHAPGHAKMILGVSSEF